MNTDHLLAAYDDLLTAAAALDPSTLAPQRRDEAEWLIAHLILSDPILIAAADHLLKGADTVVVDNGFDRVDPAQVQTGRRHPRGNNDWPAVGIFAQRAKARPNRIGVSVCRLLRVDGLTVTVEGLDAIDATPVLDLKPYMAELAPRGELRQPAWSHELMAGYWAAPTAPSAQPAAAASLRRSYDAVASRYAAEIGGVAGRQAARPGPARLVRRDLRRRDRRRP